MMRSLFSGVSGLKVHQTKMDVLGNNISNVNTVGFKASSVRFSDVFYQTTQSATGPNAATGAGGRNAKQIGLGANVMSITTNIAGEGASQRTDSALDMKLSGGSFFIVNSGGMNYFTRAGVFDIDAQGTLVMAGIGATVMGWQVDPDDPTAIVRDTVSPLRIMSPENMYAEPELTTNTYVTGNIDNKDADLKKDTGLPVQMSFFDNMGGSYTAKYKIVQKEVEITPAVMEADGTTVATPAVMGYNDGEYEVVLTDIVDSKNQSLFYTKDANGDIIPSGNSVKFGETMYQYMEAKPDDTATTDVDESKPAGLYPIDGTGVTTLKFNSATGGFEEVGAAGSKGASLSLQIYEGVTFVATTTSGVTTYTPTVDSTKYTGKFVDIKNDTSTASTLDGDVPVITTHKGIDVNFSTITMYETGGKCVLNPYKGDVLTGNGAGRKVGDMTGFSVGSDGKIYAQYDNGITRLLGQIATASFANPAGLESVGNNMYATTQNSGDFDGVGQDPTAGGGSLSTGILEMSNVDLSTEFTEMIVTQRGFQANSKIITTSDVLLDELINLKR